MGTEAEQELRANQLVASFKDKFKEFSDSQLDEMEKGGGYSPEALQAISALKTERATHQRF